jgi:hypothetical protein
MRNDRTPGCILVDILRMQESGGGRSTRVKRARGSREVSLAREKGAWFAGARYMPNEREDPISCSGSRRSVSIISTIRR